MGCSPRGGSRALPGAGALPRLEVQEQRRLGDAERAESVLVGGGELGALADGAGGPGEGDEVHAPEFVRMLRQVWLVWLSAIRIRSSASQESRTCARMRSSLRWKTGRSSSVVFRSRKPRSISSSFL